MALEPGARTAFLTIRVFIAFFFTLFGLALVVKGDAPPPVFLGSIFAALGLTFLTLLWMANRS